MQAIKIKQNDISGQRFGNLVAVMPIARKGRHRAIVWLWQCDCGKQIKRISSDIKRGHQKSCGCMRKEYVSRAVRKEHGVAAFNTLLYQYKNGARHRGLTFQLSPEEFKTLTKGNCYYCGREPSTKYIRKNMHGEYIYNGIDRIDNERGYETGNVVSCCSVCNVSKLDKTEEEFLQMVEKVFRYRIEHASGE